MRDIHNKVQLIPWQESWAQAYDREQQRIMGALTENDHSAEVLHVGSTSVEGMVSKPIIDILVCPNDDVPPEKLIPALEEIGYRNLGECGRPGRYFLSCGEKPNETFYLHLCHKGHRVAQDQLLFQHLERTNPDIFSGYYKLKLMLAEAFYDDRLMYRELKGIYIEGVLSVYRTATRMGE